MTERITLTAHRLPYEIVELVKEAERYVVLATGYLHPWRHLTEAVRDATQGGVRVHLITRTPDGWKNEKKKIQKAFNEFTKLDITATQVEKFHAKVYLNEKRAIVTSMNLVGQSHDSIEFGMESTESDFHAECFSFLAKYAPEIREFVDASEAPREQAEEANGFCIGCKIEKPFDLEKPLCRGCYRKSKRATDYSLLPQRSCHACGKENASTVEKPVCYDCYKKSAAAG